MNATKKTMKDHIRPAPKKYSCDIQDYQDFADEGQWRSYSLQAEGDTLDELFDDCTIFETDQDGGEIRNYRECGSREEIAIRNWLEKEKAKEMKQDQDFKPIIDPRDEG